MPRDIPVGNGRMLVCFDQRYQLRDLYFPNVGQENHAGGAIWRFGVWGELVAPGPRERRKRRLAWTSEAWEIELGYPPDTLATDARLHHPEMALRLNCRDVVDFNRDVLIRRIEVHNEHDAPRTVRLFAHTDLRGLGFQVAFTEDTMLRGVTFNDSLFDRTDLYTAYLGGARHAEVTGMNEDDLAREAEREFERCTGHPARAISVAHERMPAWDLSWRALQEVELPDGLHLAGNWWSRPGLPGRVAEAETLAARLTGRVPVA